MLAHLRPAIVLTLIFIVLTGLAYPLAITGIGQLAFPAQANGSLVRDGDTVVGSALMLLVCWLLTLGLPTRTALPSPPTT